MTVTCPFVGRCKDCDGALKDVGAGALDQVGGFLPARQYSKDPCPQLVVMTVRSGEPFRPEDP